MLFFASLFFLLVQFIFGIVLLRFFDKKNLLSLIEKIVSGAIIGMIVGFLLALIFSVLTKNIYWGALISFALEVAVIVWQWKYLSKFFRETYLAIKNRSVSVKKSHKIIVGTLLLLLLLAGWGLVALGVFTRSGSGVLQAVTIGWGDTAYHLSMIEHFANAGKFNLDQPIFSGTPLTYPFLINFASAVLLKFNWGILAAFNLPLLLMGVCAIALLFLFALRIFKSSWAAFGVLLLVLFGSGLGFWWFFQDVGHVWNNSPNPIVQVLANPPHQYTHLDMRTGGKPQSFDGPQNIVWIVPVISFLSHQRSFVWGLALFAVIILMLWLYRDDKSLWRLGFLAGIVPLAHGHTFLALGIAGAGWLICAFWAKKPWKNWVAFGALSAIVASPFLWFLNNGMNFLGQGTGKSFFRLQFGWMTCNHTTSWFFCSPQVGTDNNALVFWSKNFGINFWIWLAVILMALIGWNALARYWKEKHSFEFFSWIAIPSVLLFLVPNFIIFQPWEFDNNKVIFYWWILSAFISIGFLRQIFLHAKGRSWRIAAAVFVSLLVFLGAFSGLIDVQARVFHFFSDHNSFWSDAQKNVAQWVLKNTDSNAIFLTSSNPTQSLLTIAGRQLYLGYEGWLWSQGIDYFSRVQNVKQILEGEDLKLACQKKIKYILLDNDLLQAYPNIDLNFWRGQNVVYRDETNNTLLIKLNCNN